MFHKKKNVGGVLLSALIASSLAGCFSSEKEVNVATDAPKLQIKVSDGDTRTLQYQRNSAGDRSGEDTQATYNIHVLNNVDEQKLVEDLCPRGFVLDHGNNNRPFKVGSTLHCFYNASNDLVSVDIDADGSETFSERAVVTNLELIWAPKSAEIHLKQLERANGLITAIENSNGNVLPIEKRYSKDEFKSLIKADFNALLAKLQKELKSVENNAHKQEENASSWT